jgi:hypothetical protein
MAHKICDFLDKTEGKIPQICDDKCEYFKFLHLEVACVLSEVFSVRKGEMCYIKKINK